MSGSRYPSVLSCCLALFAGGAEAESVASEAINFLTVHVSCNPPVTPSPASPPWEHMVSYKQKFNKFLGNLTVFKMEESVITLRAKNTSTEKWVSAMEGFGYILVSTARFQDIDANVRVVDRELKLTCLKPNCFEYSRTANAVAERLIKSESINFRRQASTQTYEFCNADTARRVARAIATLIKENGGKESRF